MHNARATRDELPQCKPRLHRVAPLIVAILALLLRLCAVAQLPIDYDEDDYMRAAQEFAAVLRASDWAKLTETNYRAEHPPLAKLLYGAVMAPLPPTDLVPDHSSAAAPAANLPEPHLTWTRRLAAALGTLTAAILALLSPAAGLLLAIHTFTIKYTSQLMLEALPALTSLIAVTAYYRSQSHGKAWVWVSALALGATVASKYVYGIAGIAILVDWLRVIITHWQHEKRSLWLQFGPLLLWGALALLTFLAADPFLWPAPWLRLTHSLTFHSGYTASQHVADAALPWYQPLNWLFMSVPWHPGVFLIKADYLIAALATVGAPRLLQRRPVFGIWLLLALIFLLVWPTKWPQYILILTVPLSLAAAQGLGLTLPWARRILRLKPQSDSTSS